MICCFSWLKAPPAPNRLPVADFQGDGTDRGILICEGAALMLNKALPTKQGFR